MHIIVCVDDDLGMTFHHRRQSRDRLLRKRILKLTRNSVLWMNEYSAKQFSQDDAPQLRVDGEFLSSAKTGEFCFVEDEALAPYAPLIEKIFLYRWNRKYPSDRKFDLDLNEGGWRSEESTDFPGSSHAAITEEVYVR